MFVNAVDVDADADELPTTDDLLDAAIAGLDADRSAAELLRRAALFRGERRRVQRRAIDELGSALPLQQLHVPLVAGRLDGATLARLARDVRRGGPAGVASRTRR